MGLNKKVNFWTKFLYYFLFVMFILIGWIKKRRKDNNNCLQKLAVLILSKLWCPYHVYIRINNFIVVWIICDCVWITRFRVDNVIGDTIYTLDLFELNYFARITKRNKTRFRKNQVLKIKSGFELLLFYTLLCLT